MLVQVLIFFLVSLCRYECALNSSEIKYIGNTYSVEEYGKLDICNLEVCKKDAEKIISIASPTNFSDPCLVDFFCGNFLTNFNGVDMDAAAEVIDYLKLALEETINEDEPKIIALVKNYHQKCVSPDNWKSSNFNIIKALTSRDYSLIESSLESKNQIITHIQMKIKELDEDLSDSFILEVLRDGFNLSNDISTEMISNFEHFESKSYRDGNKTTTVKELNTVLNITSEVDWLQILKLIHKNDDINNDTAVLLDTTIQRLSFIFDLKNRRILANLFSLKVLEYFSFHFLLGSSKDRNEICIEQLKSFANFPLEVIFQMKYGNEETSKAFKEYVDKFKTIEGSNDNSTQVGFPDELTNRKFIDELYANLSLTGEEGLYKMRQEMMDYSKLIYHSKYNPIHMKNLSKDAKTIFKCGKKHMACSGIADFRNKLFFRVKDTLYPMFHKDRPYYVNLVLIGQKIHVPHLNFQTHYSKYLEKFSPEQHLPGFLLKNNQMVEMIERQTRCTKGYSMYYTSNNVFDCVSYYDII